jgi:hypothetical protein
MADYTPKQADGVEGEMRSRYLDMLDTTHALVVAIGNAISVVDPWSIGLYADQTASGSDKIVTVPAGQLWHILWIWAELTTDAVQANRQMEVQIEDPEDDTILQVRAGAVQAASLTYNYAFAPSLADLTAVRDTTFLMTPLPPTLLLPPDFKVRVRDNTLTGGSDNVIIQMQYAYKAV